MDPVPAFSAFGEPVFKSARLAGLEDSVLAPPGGMDYVRGSLCKGNDDSCGAPRAKGTELCIGHLRRQEKEAAGEHG